jgi:hypothetical protein
LPRRIKWRIRGCVRLDGPKGPERKCVR